MFSIVLTNVPFVQVLHFGNTHWAVVSNVDPVGGYYSNSIGYYDSAYPLSLRKEVKRTICSFYKTTCNTVLFDIINVENQRNSHDCGVNFVNNIYNNNYYKYYLQNLLHNNIIIL